jgi:aerobic-type carbon monoxide dehydrogenase small subunit (CoxS/CutS family)
VGVVLGGAATLPVGRAGAAEGGAGAPAVLGPGAVPVGFTLNGKKATVEVEPRVTLLDALRQRLDLTGAKRVCDRGACGACTVQLDGVPVNSCMVLAVDVEGRTVNTIEGLAQGDQLHPVQAAFVEHDALQCGFCTPGMVMAVKCCLDRNPKPSLEEVRHAVSGNLCRCGTYPRVFAAALDAAARMGKGG